MLYDIYNICDICIILLYILIRMFMSHTFVSPAFADGTVRLRSIATFM